MAGILKLLSIAISMAIVSLVAAPGANAEESSAADQIAHFLAGMEPSAGSPLTSLTSERSWQQHAKTFDAAWATLEARQLSKVSVWSGANIKQHQSVLYYMFSGPDFLYANEFFPNATTYIMSGLESPGAIPDAGAITARTIPSELNGIRSALGNLFRHSYFITSEMGHQLSRSRLSGTIPVIYVFLARSGKTIRDVSLVSLDKEGKVHLQSEQGVESTAKGVKIVFAGRDGREQTLYYFQTDLSDKGVANSGFLQFCEQFGTGDSFIKSASYLLHNGSFSSVRNFLQKNSATLVQDDTGIPMRYLNPSDWEFHPFGTYLRPIAQFRGNGQPKLVELFRNNRAAPLNFTVGYRWGKPSNLLLAVRRPAA